MATIQGNSPNTVLVLTLSPCIRVVVTVKPRGFTAPHVGGAVVWMIIGAAVVVVVVVVVVVGGRRREQHT